MSLLAPVLTAADLPDAELQAARLDGELFDLADAYCLIGELEGPAHRARAALGARSPRLIAELRTAAWVWGAAERPERLQFAVTPDARARLSPDTRITVRELVFAPADVVDLGGGVRVTSPMRTILDLARHEGSLDPGAARRLAETAGLDLADCLAELESRVGVPGKRRAQRALAALTP